MTMTFERRKNLKALFWTAGVHLLLLCLFLLFKYTLPAQYPVEEMGMEVNLGTTDDGRGTDQPEIAEDPAALQEAASVAVASPEERKSETAPFTTSDDPDAPAVETKPKNNSRQRHEVAKAETVRNRKIKTPEVTSTRTVQQPKQTARYVYPGSAGKGGNAALDNKPGGNEGIGSGDGDMGVPGGTPGASSYTGTPGGGGTSIGHSLSGRSIVSRPDPRAEFKEGGKVVIRVTVNREGRITDSRVVSAANATIRALALKKLQSVRFNQSSTAPAEQFGNITFDFKATRK